MASLFSKTIIDGWLEEMVGNATTNTADDPNYWAQDPKALITTSQPLTFSVGTGHQILRDVFSACESAKREVIIVTCFWARSKSAEDVSALLRKLSDKTVRENRPAIRVRICISSCSAWQKLTQTESLNGVLYQPSNWKISRWKRLGLPSPEEIPGAKVVLKSVFVRPFSVMHPKFIIVDRERAFLPSCNVSWENWFEGCVEIKGGIVDKLFEFWDEFWSRGGAVLPDLYPETDSEHEMDVHIQTGGSPPEKSMMLHLDLSSAIPSTITTILLPSPHHRRINPCPDLDCWMVPTRLPPPTPLNTFLIRIFRAAKEGIYLQTPNVTCQPVLWAIDEALARGVDVQIVTSRRLMVMEQIATAHSTTEVELKKLRRRHRHLIKNYNKNSSSDPEAALRKPGALRVAYYHPKDDVNVKKDKEEPVKTHIKLTIVDDEIVVLGSGNMDHASWYTSQELGVAFFSKELAKEIGSGIMGCLDERVKYVTEAEIAEGS